MSVKQFESSAKCQPGTDGIRRTQIKVIPSNLELSRRFIQLVVQSVISVNNVGLDELNNEHCSEPDCEEGSLLTLSQYPQKLIPRDGEPINIPNFDMSPEELEDIGLEFEEIKELFRYRRQITICLEHYSKRYKDSIG